MREPRPDFAPLPGGAVPAAPLWRDARSQRLRDLAWCTLSPPLLTHLPETPPTSASSSPFSGAAATLARWPAQTLGAWHRYLLTADPDQLPPTLDEMAGKTGSSLRLGRHAEQLLHFALRQMEGLRLVAANLPVRRPAARGIQTLGELDFVWRDLATDQIVHWEMAAKFYLLVEPGSGLRNMPPLDAQAAAAWRRCFVGPNLVDRLGDKLEHIVLRQLPLSRTPEAQALLGAPIDRAEAYLLGWLFYRDGRVPPVTAALGLAPDHLRGWWSTLEGWARRMRGEMSAARAEGRHLRWHRLPRSGWMSPALVEEGRTEDFVTLYSALTERFGDPRAEHAWRRETPVMVCEMEPAGPAAPGMWRECSRGFVVPDGWEARARVRIGPTGSIDGNEAATPARPEAG